MAGVMDGLDDDYFVIETGTDGGNLSIALENRSTTLEPELHVYDGNKQRLRGWSKGTPGADLSGMITATPGAPYYVQVRNDDRFTAGDYTLTVDVE